MTNVTGNKKPKIPESRLSYRYFLSPVLLIIIGIFIIIFMVVILMLAIKSKAPGGVFIAYSVFLLIGLGFLIIGIVRKLREKKYRFITELEKIEIKPGGVIEGKIIPVGDQKKFDQPGKVFIILQKPVFSKYRKNRLLYEKKYFSAEIESLPKQYPMQTVYSFEIELPEDFIPYENWEDGTELILLFQQGEIGIKSFTIKKQEKEARNADRKKGVFDEINQMNEDVKSSVQIYSGTVYNKNILNISITLFALFLSLGFWYIITFIKSKLEFSLAQALYLLLIQGFWGGLLLGLPILGGSMYIIKFFRENEDKKAYRLLGFIILYFISIWPVIIYLDLTGKMELAVEILSRYHISIAIFPAFLFWLLLYAFVRTIVTLIRGDRLKTNPK